MQHAMNARAVPLLLLLITACACTPDASRAADGDRATTRPTSATGASAANGSLIESTPVTLDSAALDRCEKQQPGTRKTLADVDDVLNLIPLLQHTPRADACASACAAAAAAG